MYKKIYLAACLFLVGSIVVAWLTFTSSPSSSNDAIAVPDLGMETSLAVKVMHVRRGTLVVRLTANGYAKAVRQVPLTAQISGVVDLLTVYEGKYVRQHELLLKLDNTDHSLAVAEAEEQLNQAIISYGQQRAERMNATVRIDTLEGYYLDLHRAENAYRQAQRENSTGEITAQELFLFKSEYEAAKLFAEESKQRLIASRTGLSRALISLQRAELNLSRTRLSAPFAGLIANLKVASGQQLNAGVECFTLVDIDSILLEVEILESDAPQVQMGRRATASFAAFPGMIFEGRTVALNPLVDIDKRVRRAIVAIANQDHKLLPGLYAEVKIESQFFSDRLIVPKEAIMTRDQRQVVFVVRAENDSDTSSAGDLERGGVREQNKGKPGDARGERLLAKWCYVETGVENEDEVEVLSSTFDLQPGEAVVITNHFTMAHDTAVKME